MGGALRREIDLSISLDDHTLLELAELDHPYARRHGMIQTHKLGSGHLRGPWPMRVHEQEGDLRAALHDMASPDGQAWYVWLDPTEAEHARWVVYGTKKMLPRDVLYATAEDPAVRKALMRAFVTIAGKGLRSQGYIRFTPSSTLGGLGV